MATDYNQLQGRLVTGVNCNVYAGDSPASAVKVGFVSEFSMRVQVQTQKADVLGNLTPVSIDATGVNVSTTLRGFIPKKDVTIDGSAKNLNDFAIDTDSLIDTGEVSKIPYIAFVDENKSGSSKRIVGATTWAIITGTDISGNGKGYPTFNHTLESIGFTHD